MFLKQLTYDLVNTGNLGLEDGDGISNRWLLVEDGSGSETSSSHIDELLVHGFVDGFTDEHLPIFQTFKLSLQRISKLPNFGISKLPNFGDIPNFETYKLAY